MHVFRLSSTILRRGRRIGPTDAVRLKDLILNRVRPFLLLSVRIAVLLVLYVVLEKLVRATANLPQESYTQRFIVVELGEQVVRLVSGSLLLVVTASLVLGIVVIWSPTLRRNLSGMRHGWAVLEHGHALRLFVTFVVFILAWTFSTYAFNLYFDEGHYVDRLLLILLVPLVFWRPEGVLPFLLVLVAVSGQFAYPLSGYTMTEINLLVRILVLFSAALVLCGVTGRRKVDDFLFLLFCLIAANYWSSGVGKVEINWIVYPHLHLMMVGAYATGWLTFLSPSSLAWLAGMLEWMNLPLMVMTLLLEASALFILWRRFALLSLLCGFIVLHLGIFAVSGIFFWKWILLEAGMLIFLLGRRRAWQLSIFTRPHFLLSLILIGAGSLWASPANLSWYDTPVTYTYRMEGVGESGTTYRLPTRVFAPYADVFLLKSFKYLAPQQQLTNAYGVTHSRVMADTLLRLTTPDHIYELEQPARTTSEDEFARERFDEFMVRFIGNLNVRGSNRTWFSPVQAPPHLWSFPSVVPFPIDEPITRVIVYQVTSFYNGERYAEIRKLPLREIVIPSAGSSAAERH